MDGFLNINKAAGWTSHDVVACIRRLLTRHLSASGGLPSTGFQPRRFRVGHAGTLDPQATGVLPVCLGKATRLVEFLLDCNKQYRVVMKLGETTDTQDADGRVLTRTDAGTISRDQVEKTLKSFEGKIQQVPPMYSALKVKGQPLYKLARKGQVIDRAPREVTITSLTLLGMHQNEVTFEGICSRGTYVRTLCADIGERLGVGAHCLRLERRRYGPFKVEEAMTLEEFEAALGSGKYTEIMYPLEVALTHLPELVLRHEGVERILNGVPIGPADIQWPTTPFQKGDRFRVTVPEMGLVAIARALVDFKEIRSDRVQGPLFKTEKVLVEKRSQVWY